MPFEPATLTGLAIGDALGVPFETHHFTSQTLMDWGGNFVDSKGLNDRQPERLAGEWTDDTQMALCVAKSLVECSVYSPVHAAATYVEWYKSGDHRGIGKTTIEAMGRLIQGHHWNSSGVLHSQGNGTAMRIAPLGLFYRKSMLTICDMARIDACITHRSEEAQEGSVAVALAVGLLAQKIVEKGEILTPIMHLMHSSGPTLTLVESRLSELEVFFREPRDLTAVMTWAFDKGTGAVVSQTVPAAFLCFMATKNFKDAVELAVRLGGDTDTIAAITGAIAGTYYGTEQVTPYVPQLENGAYLQHLDHVLWLEAPDIPADI
jgi:ADP-ribosylglycohydrolase